MKLTACKSNNPQRWSHVARAWTASCMAASAMVLAFTGLAQAQDKAAENPIEALGETYNLQNKVVPASQSRIIFYSPTSTPMPGAATVYVNGRYHTSLVPGGYSTICLPPGKVQLGTRQINVKTRPNKDGMDSITQLTAQGSQNQFVRVMGNNSKNIALVPVKAAEAEIEVAPTRLQKHTISRVPGAVECENVDAPVQAVAKAAPVLAPASPSLQLQLSGDTLFAFDRGDAKGLTRDGLRAIDQLMAQVKSEFSRVDRIQVIGHTDPFGSEAHNAKLSAQRAQTVRQYMESRQQINAPIGSEGRGSRQLINTQCGKAQTTANIACNQVNRRVSVEVTGLKRQQ